MPMLSLLLGSLLAQTAPATETSEALRRAAEAAQRAAEAAERAAAAAEKAAEANRPSAAPAEAAAKAAEAAAKAAEAAKAAAPPPSVIWTGTVALGLIVLTGNSQSITFSTSGAFERKSPDWIWGIKGSAAYGQTARPLSPPPP